jgi:EAL and modified HD-GYP domain-containing signal transduction protein
VHAINSSAAEAIDHISIARQPIVDEGRNIFAYELFNRSKVGANHTVASDISLGLNAIANNGAPFSIANSDLFVHALHAGLAAPHWDFLDPKSIVASIPLVHDHDPVQIANVAVALGQLRARGFRLSFNHVVVAPLYKEWQPLADFVKVDLASVANSQLKPLVSAIQARTSATAIAMKVETSVQFTHLQSIGVKLFQGYLFSVPEIVTPRVLSPSQIGAVRLFNLVSKSASIEEVEDCLKKDEALGVNLLRIINSAGVGLSQKVTSLRQAVMLLGYDKLTKWSALVLATSSSKKPNLLNLSAIVRGRMMELLAEEDRAHLDPGSAFLIGLLSQIESMLGCPLQSALKQLSLDEEIIEILLGGEGVYGDMLSLTKACELDDDAEFARAFSQLKFTLRQVNIAHMEALAWADAALS